MITSCSSSRHSSSSAVNAGLVLPSAPSTQFCEMYSTTSAPGAGAPPENGGGQMRHAAGRLPTCRHLRRGPVAKMPERMY